MLRLVYGFIIFQPLIFYGVSQLAILGPANLIYHGMEYCDEQTNINLTIKQKKYNRTTHVLDIIFDVPFDLDDSVILELKASTKKQGGYKPGSFYMKDKACETLKILLGATFADFLKAAGTDRCPLPAGHNEILNYYFDNEKFIVPQVYGEYKMEVFIYKNKVRHGCSVFYYKLAPKTEFIF